MIEYLSRLEGNLSAVLWKTRYALPRRTRNFSVDARIKSPNDRETKPRDPLREGENLIRVAVIALTVGMLSSRTGFAESADGGATRPQSVKLGLNSRGQQAQIKMDHRGGYTEEREWCGPAVKTPELHNKHCPDSGCKCLAPGPANYGAGWRFRESTVEVSIPANNPRWILSGLPPHCMHARAVVCP